MESIVHDPIFDPETDRLVLPVTADRGTMSEVMEHNRGFRTADDMSDEAVDLHNKIGDVLRGSGMLDETGESKDGEFIVAALALE